MGEASRLDAIVAGGQLRLERPARRNFADAVRLAFEDLANHAVADRKIDLGVAIEREAPHIGRARRIARLRLAPLQFLRLCRRAGDADHGLRAPSRRRLASVAPPCALRRLSAGRPADRRLSRTAASTRCISPGAASGQPSASSNLARHFCFRPRSSMRYSPSRVISIGTIAPLPESSVARAIPASTSFAVGASVAGDTARPRWPAESFAVTAAR